MKKIFSILICAIMVFPLFAQSIPEINLNNILEYRAIGPYKAGSWISAIAVPETENPVYKYTYYIGARHGGVWKTINNGTTYFPVFDSVRVASIGAIAVSKSNPEVVWVGTGESYAARSTHSGKGIYVSNNGGKTWESKGLEDSQHISAILIHPERPNEVLVSSMGHLFSPNEERGIFKTVDGGNTWQKVLYIDENTGIIEMIQNPENPNILFASAYEKYRYPWHFEAGGIHSGIYKSEDGGDSWTLLKNGLPNGKLGRIGLALCYEQPNIVYTVIENLNPKEGIDIDESSNMDHMRDNYFDQFIGGEVYRSTNNGESWEKRNTDECNMSAKAAYSFNKIMVHPQNPERIHITSDAMISSLDGGKTWLDCSWPTENFFVNMFGDFRCMWVNPKDGNHMIIGSDGGVFVTYDGAKNMAHHYNIPLGEIYMVEYDDQYPYNVYFGLQDHDGWKAPSNDWSGRIGPEDWNLVGMWDGMYTVVDHTDNRWVYISTQFGGHRRVDQKLGKRYDIEPVNPDTTNPYRFPWTPPIAISPHDSKTIYTGGQFLLRSKDQGDTWEEISPDLTTNNAEKIAGKGHMMYCTISTISESVLQKGQIWVGTDDGRIHSTFDNGKTWTEHTQQIADLGGRTELWISRVYTSVHDEKTAYVCKHGFKNDIFDPLVFKTTDGGKNWKKITNGISNAPVNVIIEDPKNKNVLYLGNDEGVFYTLNQGLNWNPLTLNMPAVPVKDLKIHPKELDLIVGSYGRGGYIVDVSVFSQLNDKVLKNKIHLFDIETKPLQNFSPQAYWGNYEFTGDNHLHTPNEANALTVYSYFKEINGSKANIIITNKDLSIVDTITFEPKQGLNKILIPTRKLKVEKYNVKLTYNGKNESKEAIIRKSPVWSVGKNAL